MASLSQRVRGLTGWAKAASTSAIVLLISLGLCGVNHAAFAVFDLPIGGGSVPGHADQERLGGLLIMTAFAEAAAILLSAAALLVSLLGLLFTFLFRREP